MYQSFCDRTKDHLFFRMNLQVAKASMVIKEPTGHLMCAGCPLGANKGTGEICSISEYWQPYATHPDRENPPLFKVIRRPMTTQGSDTDKNKVCDNHLRHSGKSDRCERGLVLQYLILLLWSWTDEKGEKLLSLETTGCWEEKNYFSK